ncbi:MAG TPA: hypothetical protein VGH68_21060, partial [Paraburkholderia sp.]
HFNAVNLLCNRFSFAVYCLNPIRVPGSALFAEIPMSGAACQTQQGPVTHLDVSAGAVETALTVVRDFFAAR